VAHRELIQSVAGRISDKHLLKLIKRWLLWETEQVVGQLNRKLVG
jgi:hypothetical protein